MTCLQRAVRGPFRGTIILPYQTCRPVIQLTMEGHFYGKRVFRPSGRERPSLRLYSGLANSRFYTLLFGINGLRSDELPHGWAKSRCSGAFVQLLCNQNFNGISGRCTPITSANDGASCGFPTFRRAVRRSPDQSTHARLLLPIRPCA